MASRALPAAGHREARASAPASEQPSELTRLLQARADLESAIAECSVALEEVRRELGWRDEGPSRVIH
jgi:hypothetical protein